MAVRQMLWLFGTKFIPNNHYERTTILVVELDRTFIPMAPCSTFSVLQKACSGTNTNICCQLKIIILHQFINRSYKFVRSTSSNRTSYIRVNYRICTIKIVRLATLLCYLKLVQFVDVATCKQLRLLLMRNRQEAYWRIREESGTTNNS